MYPSDIRLDQPYEGVGEWWLADNPHAKYHGRVKYAPDSGVQLECSGHLTVTPFDKPTIPCTVLGKLEDNRNATLFNAVGSRVGPVYSVGQKFSANSLLIGLHASSINSPISGVTLTLDQFNEWMSFGPFGGDNQRRPAGSTSLIDYHVEYDPDGIQFALPGTRYRVVIGSSFTETGFGHEVTLEHGHSLSIESDADKSLAEFIQIAQDFEVLLTLITGFPSPIRSFHVLPKNAPEYGAVDCIFLYNRALRKAGHKFFSRDDMPANYQYIEGNLPVILDKWLIIAQKFAPVISLLRGTMFLPGPSHLQNRFLALAQALEGYCRIAANEMYLPRCDFAVIKKAMHDQIPSNASDELRTALMGKIGRMNEFSFRERVLSLFNRYDWLRSVITSRKAATPTPDDVTAFAKRLVDARNSLTHIESGRELSGLIDYSLVSDVRNILCLLLMHEAGIPAEVNYRRVQNEWGTVMWWVDDIYID